MSSLTTYLRDLSAIRSTGATVPETTFYPLIERLLTDAGASLRPRVRCILHPGSRGAGLPDAGLFTADQFRPGAGEPVAGQIPARGVLEVKGTREEVDDVARTPQVQRYLERYGQVLVTNYRDFLLLGRTTGGVVQREVYRLATDEASFWEAAAHPERTAARLGDGPADFLRRALMRGATLTAPEDVAWLLAADAREARALIENSHLPALHQVRAALEQSLGVTFREEEGERFFRSTFIQTIFYGVFSAWVLWSRQQPPEDAAARFDWRMSAYYLHVPMIRALFHQVTDPGHLRSLGLVDVLDRAGETLNRVARAEFLARFEGGDGGENTAVQYFYEPFLEKFDPDLRKRLGVWYTPAEIVRYQVERVDQVLRAELGLEGGLANDRVYVLDPCCGTGAYLVEVVRHIHRTLAEGGGDALAGNDIKTAVTRRIFGFELLPAPFVVAHLQLGLELQRLGAALSDERQERAQVFLTNALTGWDAGVEDVPLPYPEMAAERSAAEAVKRDAPILVVIGNPPYDGYAGVAVGEERDLSEAYRRSVRAPQPQGRQNELAVRFFRMAERRIVEGTGEGVVSFIANYSWLDKMAGTAMRERYLGVFTGIWIDNLHGDRIISERAPDGRTSETVFAVQGTSPGIKVGTAVSLLVRKRERQEGEQARVRYRDWHEARAADRRRALLESAAGRTAEEVDSGYATLTPVLELGLPFKPGEVGAGYLEWPRLIELFPALYPGVKTSRDEAVVDVDRERLVARMETYFDSSLSHEAVARLVPDTMRATGRFDPVSVREQLLRRGVLPGNVIRYAYRPMDTRWLYWEPQTKLLDEKRADLYAQVFEGNRFLVSQQKPRRAWAAPQVVSRLGCLDLMDRSASCIPLLRNDNLLGDRRYNLSPEAAVYLSGVSPSEHPQDEVAPDGPGAAEDLFYHALAVLHAPAYKDENAGALRQDWPRIPLPATDDALRASAALGRRVAALLDPELPVPGVTTGPLAPELSRIGTVSRADGSTVGLDPASGHLAVTAHWGHRGPNGIMSAPGRQDRRDYTPEERSSVTDDRGDAALALLGAHTHDLYLNDVAVWRNVPGNVLAYCLGGYPVITKWLSYRTRDVLGRDLEPAEAREVSGMARRIAALLMLSPDLDANYAATAQAAHVWPPSRDTDQPSATSAEETT